jgi:hypothetical protein
MLKQILCGLSLLGAASFANAAIIYTTLQNDSVSGIYTDWTSGDGNIQTLTLGQFDDLGGTRILSSVELIFSGDINSTGDLTNTSDDSSTSIFTFDLVSYFSLKFIDETDANLFNARAKLIPDESGTPPIVIGSGESLTIEADDLKGDNSKVQTYTSGSEFNKFLGTGDIVFKATTQTFTYVASTGGNFDQSLTTIGGAVVGVIYGYEMAAVTVPEPGALAIVGLALAGMGFSVRRRKSSI